MNEAKLTQLAEMYEEKARSIRSTIALWQEVSGERAVNGFRTTLNGAIKLRGPYKKRLIDEDGNGDVPAARGGAEKRVRRSAEEMRQAVMDALAHGPSTAVELSKLLGYATPASMYGLVARLKKQHVIEKGPVSDGGQTYILAGATEQPVRRKGKAKKKVRTSNGSSEESRQRTAAILAGLSETEPMPIPGRGIAGVLLSSGYVKKKGDKLYVRTNKEFTA